MYQARSGIGARTQVISRMSEDFDAYYKWLAIPPEEQPPNHYRLLGVRPFESDLDVISNAADQRMAHVRTYQNSRHAGLSQKVLNEIATAKVCLLNLDRKAAYDAQLQRQTSAAPPEFQSEAPPVAPPAGYNGYGMPAAEPFAASAYQPAPAPAPRYQPAPATAPRTHSQPALVQPAMPQAAPEPGPISPEPRGVVVASYPRGRKKKREHSSMPAVIGFMGVCFFIIALVAVLRPRNEETATTSGKEKPANGVDGQPTTEGSAEQSNSSGASTIVDDGPATGGVKRWSDFTSNLPMHLRGVAESNRIVKNQPVGGLGNTFEDLTQPVGALIGFDFSIGEANKQRVFKSIQPLYYLDNGPAGIRMGARHGKPDGPISRIMAKPGYAIGKATVWADQHVEAVELIFMRITDQGLDAADQYAPNPIGVHASSSPTDFGGNGQPIVGVTGRQVMQELRALGFMSLGDAGATPPSVQPTEHVIAPSKPEVKTDVPLNDAPSKLSKAAIPAGAELLAARKKMREHYQQEFVDATTLPRKAALADKLLKDAALESDPTARYVLLDEARKKGIDAGESGPIVSAIKALESHYAIDDLELMVAALTETEHMELVPAQKKRLATDALAQFELAVTRGKSEAAERLITIAQKSAAKANDPELIQQVLTRARKFRDKAG